MRFKLGVVGLDLPQGACTPRHWLGCLGITQCSGGPALQPHSAHDCCRKAWDAGSGLKNHWSCREKSSALEAKLGKVHLALVGAVHEQFSFIKTAGPGLGRRLRSLLAPKASQQHIHTVSKARALLIISTHQQWVNRPPKRPMPSSG
jgi:hypothetical protein